MSTFNPSDYNYSDTNPNRFVSGFLNQNGVDSPFLTDHIYIDDNDVLHAQPDFNIEENLGEALALISAYSSLNNIYHQKMRVYKGDHAVLRKHPYDRFLNERKENMIVNIPKNMVNTFSGFFNGIPPKIHYAPSDNENGTDNDTAVQIDTWINQQFNNSHYSDILYELGKKADIYGRSYLITYIDKNSNVKFKDISPEQCIIVYANTLDEEPLFSIYYQSMGGTNYGQIFTPNHIYNLQNLNESDASTLVDDGNNVFGQVPVIEMPENDERLGIFDDAMSAVDKLDKAYSLKFNDVDYFSNAILFLKGFKKLSDEQRKSIKRYKVLQDTGDNPNVQTDANYLAKPQNDQQQQNFIHDVEAEIYQNAQIINLSDPNLGASASGDALGKKLQPMVMLADSKARKMTNVVKQLLSIILLSCPYIQDKDIPNVVADTQIKFTPNIPHSLLDESNIVKNLNGIVSLPTLLSYLSNINNISQEVTQIKADRQSNMQTIQGMSSNNSNEDDDSNNDGSYSNNDEDDD